MNIKADPFLVIYKLIFTIMIITSVCLFVSCGSDDSTSQNNIVPQNNQNNVVPQNNQNNNKNVPFKGFRHCSNGCKCGEYVGRGNICENCGHHYDAHY